MNDYSYEFAPEPEPQRTESILKVSRIISLFSDVVVLEKSSLNIHSTENTFSIVFTAWGESFYFALNINLDSDLVELTESEDPNPISCSISEALELVEMATLYGLWGMNNAKP